MSAPGSETSGPTAAPGGSPRTRTTSAARRAALADLVAGLLEARQDSAGARFDGELEALERAGEVSPTAARLLRYWQRASVRALVDHARLVLPPTLAALDEADDDARRAVDDDSETWSRALANAAETGPGEQAAEGWAPRPDRGSDRTPTSLEEHRRRLLIAGLTRDASVER